MRYKFPNKLLIVKSNTPKEVELASNEKINVYPAKVVPSKSKNFVMSATYWGNNLVGGATFKTVDNEPFKLTMVGYTHGYPKVQVFDDNEIYSTLDLSIFFRFTKKYGVSPGGVINTEFIWAQNHNAMKIVQKDYEDELLLRDIIS